MTFAETYSVWAYGEMISDKIRMEAYTEALRQAVKPGCVVLDIGTGTGVFAMLACRFGARKVFAIEPSASVHVAREIAAANGLADQIEFINDFSTNVTLPEQADVLISDLRSVLPFFQEHFRSIADARKRLLAPEATMIPAKDQLWACLVSGPDFYNRIVSPYIDNPYGFDMRPTLRYITNEWRKGSKLQADDLFMEAQPWVTLDYSSWDQTDAAGELSWVSDRAETVNGFCLWFDAQLAEGIGFTNAPGHPDLIYGRAYFPWSSPVELAAGDRVTVSLNAKKQGAQYIWSWQTRIMCDDAHKAEFDQSTFLQAPLSLAQLRKRMDDYVPSLSGAARIHAFVLEQMKSETTLGEIAERVVTNFPDDFEDIRDAFHEVAELSEKYSK